MPGHQTNSRRIAMFSQLRAKPAEFHVFDTTLRDGSSRRD